MVVDSIAQRQCMFNYVHSHLYIDKGAVMDTPLTTLMACTLISRSNVTVIIHVFRLAVAYDSPHAQELS